MTAGSTKLVRTMCPMNCHPTFCGMLVEVEGGKLKTVSGDKDNPDSQGFLCVRGRSTNEIFGNPRRLLYPQIRDDRRTDTWRRVSWDEALDFIVKRMRAVGPEAVGLWAGHGSFTPGSAVTVQMMQRFANIYGCQNWHPAMICWGLGAFGVGLTGALKVNTKEDMAENSRMIVLCGANIASQPNTARHIISARRRGAKVVTIDVRRKDVVLPGTAWLEELGFKVTNTHLYLMERALERAGETRPIYEILASLAKSLGLAYFFPWGSVEEVLDAILDHPTTGHATVASLRAAGGFLPLEVPHVAYANRKFDSPSGKIEFYSAQAGKLGLPPLPMHKVDKGSPYPLALSFGRTLTHFHAFYDEGRALPSLAKHNATPQLWISRLDAAARHQGPPTRLPGARDKLSVVLEMLLEGGPVSR